MDKVITIKKDFVNVSIALSQAKKAFDIYELSTGDRHTVLFKAPLNDNLVIIEYKSNRWKTRKCTSDEWTSYFYENIIPLKKKFKEYLTKNEAGDGL